MKDPQKMWWTETPLLFLLILCLIIFLLSLQKQASGLPWQEVTSQTIIKFIKKMLKHVLLTSKTTLKYTVFIQLEETLR